MGSKETAAQKKRRMDAWAKRLKAVQTSVKNKDSVRKQMRDRQSIIDSTRK
jgi:hypothetical protein